MGSPRYGGRRTELDLGLGLRRRRGIAADEPLRVPEDHAGEALAEARQEADDAVEEHAFPGRLGRQEAGDEEKIRGDAEDRADERLVEAKPPQHRPPDL